MKIHESGEMYLETILVLSKKKTNVRSIDIADHMNFSKPSVSRAVNILKNDGFIEIDPSGYITLTDSGRAIAEKIYDRHNFISSILVRLGVNEKTAVEDACAIEHVISDESIEAIKKHVHAEA
ncbi:MAG: metal-dependent transcriptional regulator [Candidatus Alectryocaccobium sp.]|jgi:DtxR family Mn-dependent transcriptional regulator